MEALLCKKLGDPTIPVDDSVNSPLTLSKSHPIPQLNSPTAVRVRVKATSLNFANYLQILGKYQEKPPLPFIPGSDYSGIVESVGSNVTKSKIGDAVCSFTGIGSFAQCIVADETELRCDDDIQNLIEQDYDMGSSNNSTMVPGSSTITKSRNLSFHDPYIEITIGRRKPSFSSKGTVYFGERIRVRDGCDMVAVGALPVAHGTSHVALLHRAQLRAGQVLLVLGAAGGVGVSAVQIGKITGAIVIAVARGEEKVKYLKSIGVDHVVDSSTENTIDSIKGFLKSRKLKGVDVLYDPVGGKLTKESMKLLKWGAHILIISFASGEVPVVPANIALVKNWTIHGLYWGSYKIHRPAVLEDSLKELLSWLARGLITINISHTFSLSEASLAFAALKDRKAIGKVMIAFDDHKAARSKL